MKVTWSEPAVADLVAIHDYIARDSPHYAQRFVERLIAAADASPLFFLAAVRSGWTSRANEISSPEQMNRGRHDRSEAEGC
jgi:plasmid stabilization system protein ParE